MINTDGGGARALARPVPLRLSSPSFTSFDLFNKKEIIISCVCTLQTVEEPEFWRGLSPVEFGPLPRLQDQVTVLGFPSGGDTMSVTTGVVSRIEVRRALFTSQ
jgi:hypothetical protein